MSNRQKFDLAAIKRGERSVPLTISMHCLSDVSSLSIPTIWNRVEDGTLEATRVEGRRLIYWTSAASMLGIDPVTLEPVLPEEGKPA